ncbi:MAG: hypothetical protein HRT88_03485 [Lentisphaeraceae bacterium]|nr:hypothetical protein [Lentisphaeraceae bacterium]
MDPPELQGQPYESDSKGLVRCLAFNQQGNVEHRKKGHYRLMIGIVRVNQTNVNEAMVKTSITNTIQNQRYYQIWTEGESG